MKLGKCSHHQSQKFPSRYPCWCCCFVLFISDTWDRGRPSFCWQNAFAETPCPAVFCDMPAILTFLPRILGAEDEQKHTMLGSVGIGQQFFPTSFKLSLTQCFLTEPYLNLRKTHMFFLNSTESLLRALKSIEKIGDPPTSLLGGPSQLLSA